jgi:hypothetical protein
MPTNLFFNLVLVLVAVLIIIESQIVVGRQKVASRIRIRQK